MDDNVLWLIGGPSEDTMRELLDCLEKMDQKHLFIPFSGAGDVSDVFEEIEEEHVVVIGVLGFLDAVKRCEVDVTMFEDDRLFDCVYYYPKYQGLMLNEPYKIIKYSELEDVTEDTLGTDKVFVRPSIPRKLFTGRVIDLNEKVRDLSTLEMLYTVSPDEKLLISPGRKILSEYRVVIVDGKAVTCTQYTPDELQEDLGLVAFAEKAIDLYAPQRVFVLDIARVEDEENPYRILELNPYSGCGMYTDELEEVVTSINKIAIEKTVKEKRM